MEENASRALLMAATMLITVMVLAIGVYLFVTYSQYSADAYKTMEQNQINQFNNQFLKYYGENTRTENGVDVTETILCTAHDIMTVANIAQQNNENYEISDLKLGNGNTNYVQIAVKGNNINFKPKDILINLEKLNETQKVDFIKQNSAVEESKVDSSGTTNTTMKTKYFVCRDVKISDVTRKSLLCGICAT